MIARGTPAEAVAGLDEGERIALQGRLPWPGKTPDQSRCRHHQEWCPDLDRNCLHSGRASRFSRDLQRESCVRAAALVRLIASLVRS